MPAVWEQHCYDSVLAGKAVSAENHRLAVNTANVMEWETFREFHHCYLHTDVLLADVMESYRDSFQAQSGLDLIHYVTLPGAAWDATAALGPRDTHLPHHRRAGLQGRAGLRHGRAELHLPALRSSQQPRAGRGGLQLRGAPDLHARGESPVQVVVQLRGEVVQGRPF